MVPMKPAVRHILYIIVVFLLLPRASFAQKLPNGDSLVTINGQVLGKKKKPIGGAVIEVFDKQQKIGHTISDSKGSYTIKNIVYRPNLYPDIIVSNTGYPTHVALMPIQLATASHKIQLRKDKGVDTVLLLYKTPCFASMPLAVDNKRTNGPLEMNIVPLLTPFDHRTTVINGEQIDKMAR